MGDKSRQKHEKLKPGKSIKEKRAEKRAHAAGAEAIVIIPNKK